MFLASSCTLSFAAVAGTATLVVLGAYEVRSQTKLVIRLVEPLFRFVSLSTEFVALTTQIVSSRIAPIRLVATEFVSSTPQIESS